MARRGAFLFLVRYAGALHLAALVRDRNLVVLDPRGTGWSKPGLTCRENEDAADCLSHWRASGVDLTRYQSAATADDVEALRRALGIERWNLYGLSYGTRLAQTLLRRHPQHVRSAILDSLAAPQEDEIAGASPGAAHAIQRLIDACATDAVCDRRYPDVAWVFSEASFFETCRAAGSPHPPASENEPLRSDVPALLLTGRFDPVTPVEAARLVVRTLTRAYVVEFPTLGHGVWSQSACARRIGLAFLAAPLRPPDTSCVASVPSVRWAAP